MDIIVSNNIYGEGELDPTSTIRKFRIVALEGASEVQRLLDYYNITEFGQHTSDDKYERNLWHR